MPMKRSVLADDEGGYALWVSTIRKLKRPELFLDLAQALPDLEFRMIGGPDDGELALFRSTKARASTIKNVKFFGFVPFLQTEEQFDRAILFVNTSDSEGFPNTFLQAWARGIPTVSFVDAGAHLNGQPIGLRVSSLEEMVATVARMASDNAALAEEGKRCVAYVKTNHSPDQIVGLYEQVFDELMSDGSSVAARIGGQIQSGASGESPR
jgi:glycosyltransferase involved in cell wall biosynthesis